MHAAVRLVKWQRKWNFPSCKLSSEQSGDWMFWWFSKKISWYAINIKIENLVDIPSFPIRIWWFSLLTNIIICQQPVIYRHWTTKKWRIICQRRFIELKRLSNIQVDYKSLYVAILINKLFKKIKTLSFNIEFWLLFSSKKKGVIVISLFS